MDQAKVPDRSQIISLGLAGGLGGVATVVTSFLTGRRMRVTEGVLRVVIGALVSIYWAPTAAKYLRLDHPDSMGGVAFGFGVLAMSLVSGVLRLGAAFAQDPAAMIAALRGAHVPAEPGSGPGRGAHVPAEPGSGPGRGAHVPAKKDGGENP